MPATFRRRQYTNGPRRPFVTQYPTGPGVLRKSIVRIGPLYDVWSEVWDTGDEMYAAGDRRREMTISVARSKSGAYIGSPDDARFLCDRQGIAPQLRSPQHSTCSVGYSARQRKWFGWSHRAYHGFGVGDSVRDGLGSVDGPHGKAARIETDEQARAYAEAFAEDVS